MNTPINELRNLGPSSARALSRISVTNHSELKKRTAIACFVALCELDDFKPSLNFLYAMLGALENRHWTEYKGQKGELLLELENIQEIKKRFLSES